MADFGSRNMGFFGGTSSGGGTSTGVNGLNGTTNIGLGGNLNQNTIINGLGIYNLWFGDDNSIDRINLFKIRSTNLDIENINGLNVSKILATSNSLLFKFNDNNNFYSQLSITYNLIKTEFYDTILSSQEGFNLDFNVRQYVFGGFDATISCDSTNQKIIFNTKFLQLDAITLNTAVRTPSVNTIPILINSVQYYINLST